jgi:hypothetical protein
MCQFVGQILASYQTRFLLQTAGANPETYLSQASGDLPCGGPENYQTLGSQVLIVYTYAISADKEQSVHLINVM